MGKSGLHPSNNIFPVKGSCCKLAGWGLIEDGTLPEELQEVGVPIVDLITCANSHAKDCTDIKTKRDPTFNCPIISSDTFCAVGKDEKDSCTVSYHCRQGAQLVRVRRVHLHPLKYSNGCAAPVLRRMS